MTAVRRKIRPQNRVQAVLAAVVFCSVGCVRNSSSFDTSRSSVQPGSPEITEDAYRTHKVLIEVPPGNSNPELSWATLYSQIPDGPFRTKKFGQYKDDPIGLEKIIEEKFRKALKGITRNPKTLASIKAAATAHGVEPSTVLATVLGEHTFNVDVVDDVQDYVGAAPGWATAWAKQFTTGKFGFGVRLSEVLSFSDFDKCRNLNQYPSEADRWDCYGAVWASKFAGKHDRASGTTWPSGGLRTVFFNPTAVGRTYGLGQLDPLRALMVADRVRDMSGLPMLSIDDPQSIYEAIINPNTGLHYVAANIRLAIDRYAKIANFDISRNPGVSATLYNLGREKVLAEQHFASNAKRLAAGQTIQYPTENYYGWFMNLKAAELKALMDTVR